MIANIEGPFPPIILVNGSCHECGSRRVIHTFPKCGPGGIKPFPQDKSSFVRADYMLPCMVKEGTAQVVLRAPLAWWIKYLEICPQCWQPKPDGRMMRWLPAMRSARFTISPDEED